MYPTGLSAFRKSLGKSLALALTTGLLAGCLSAPPVDSLPQAPKDIAPKLIEAKELAPYHLQVGDVMDIKLLENPELNDQVTVRPDGYISTTVAQEVKAYGRTTGELQQDLEARYTKHLRSPRVAVIVRSFAPNRVYVTGEVLAAGEFITVGPNLTMLQAIARAGGLKASARIDQILIMRRGAGEKPEMFTTNYRAAVSGADPSSDVRLASYDVVYVPRSDVADVYAYFNQYVQQFVPSSFGMSYSLNPAIDGK